MARDNGFNLLGSGGGGKVENRGGSLALARECGDSLARFSKCTTSTVTIGQHIKHAFSFSSSLFLSSYPLNPMTKETVLLWSKANESLQKRCEP